MNKTKLYLGLSVAFLIIAIINLTESNSSSEPSMVSKFMKIGWFIIAGAHFLQYLKLRKTADEKSTR